MQQSSEIRWFFEERKEVAELEQWFQTFGLQFNDALPKRDDYYLALPGVTNLGLKLREAKQDAAGKWMGKLEAKVLVKDHGMIAMQGGEGVVNEWTKFSFTLPTGEATMEEIINGFIHPGQFASTSNWIKISKQRLLLIYDLSAQRITPKQATVNEGCGIELTMLQKNAGIHYSFGFEGFSTTGNQHANFLATLEYVFDTIKLTGLSRTNSYCYPEFLSEHI